MNVLVLNCGSSTDEISRNADRRLARGLIERIGGEGLISTDSSRLAAYTIPTDEELLIARDTVRSVRGEPQRY